MRRCYVMAVTLLNVRHVSTNMADFVVADDVFWRRTCSDEVRAKYQRRGRPLPLPPIPVPEVHFADKETVVKVVGPSEREQQMRRMRLHAMLALEKEGVMRPVPRTHIQQRVRGEVGRCSVHVCNV